MGEDSADIRFDQYWIRSTDGEVVDYLIGYSEEQTQSFRWDGQQSRWLELSTSLPELEGLGGSADYSRVSEQFTERYISKTVPGEAIRIADV